MSLGGVAEEILRREGGETAVRMRESEKKGGKKKEKETRDLKQVLPWKKREGLMRRATMKNHKLLDQIVGVRSPDPTHFPPFTVMLMMLSLDLDGESSY